MCTYVRIVREEGMYGRELSLFPCPLSGHPAIPLSNLGCDWRWRWRRWLATGGRQTARPAIDAIAIYLTAVAMHGGLLHSGHVFSQCENKSRPQRRLKIKTAVIAWAHFATPSSVYCTHSVTSPPIRWRSYSFPADQSLMLPAPCPKNCGPSVGKTVPQKYRLPV